MTTTYWKEAREGALLFKRLFHVGPSILSSLQYLMSANVRLRSGREGGSGRAISQKGFAVAARRTLNARLLARRSPIPIQFRSIRLSVRPPRLMRALRVSANASTLHGDRTSSRSPLGRIFRIVKRVLRRLDLNFLAMFGEGKEERTENPPRGQLRGMYRDRLKGGP